MRTFVGWLDDRGQSPIMRQHVNDGTHTFRADEDEYRGITGLDDVLGPGAMAHEDDDADPYTHVDRNASLLDLQLQYVAANKRTVGFVVAASLSILALLGMNGVGPLSSLARIVAGAGPSLFIGAGVRLADQWLDDMGRYSDGKRPSFAKLSNARLFGNANGILVRRWPNERCCCQRHCGALCNCAALRAANL